MNKRRNNKGAALIFVIIVLMVTTLFVSAAATLTQANTRQAVGQEKGMQTYYMARSGAELAYQALRTDAALYGLFMNNYSYARQVPDVDMGEGIVDIEISTYPGTSAQRMRIRSTAILDGSTIQRTAILEFDLNNYNDLVWAQ